ncbi:MAG TPA: T9SS type B sorting domain-containing protein, partial [Crocinitomix sp.]|nr:T9SS type B sorting domain-containing protein [Crocinitomix sp.]
MKQLYIIVFTLFFINILYAQLPNDCVNSIIVCGNSNIDLDVEGVGIQELNGTNNCSSQENNTIWFKVTSSTNGTLGFTLTPNSININEDYDFFVYGPNVTCGNLGNAIRCSTTNPSMANQGNNLTGMLDTVDDELSEGPGPDGDSFVEWLTVQADETYYIIIDRPIGTSPFSLEWTGTATFYDAPNSQLPSGQDLDYESCASNGNGSATFDLTQDESLVVGNQNVFVDYYTSLSDAQIGINPILATTSFTTNSTTLFIKLTDITTACFSIFDINIDVTPFITLPDLDDFYLCELDNNNKDFFDLSQQNSLVDQLVTNNQVSYHETESNALSGQFDLPLFYENSNNPQIVWMRFEDLDTGCIGVSSFEIAVFQTPIAHLITDWFVCDDDGDGFYEFDLLSLESDILNGQNGNFIDISFHHSMDDVINNVNQLPSNYTNETSFIVEEIFVRVENNLHTECYDATSFHIKVFNTPIANQLDDWIVCDDDGFYEFDLNTLHQNILNEQDENEFDISFHISQNDADTKSNLLPQLYTNTDSLEEIFVRIENPNLPSCFDTSSFILNIYTQPAITVLDKWNICDDIDNDGFYNFDFTNLFDDILNGQDEAIIDISFYQSQVDADFKITPFDLNYTNKESFLEEEIFIRLENVEKRDCYNTTSFFIQVIENPIFDIIEDTKYLCVNLNNQSTTFEIENTQGNYTCSWQNSDGEEVSNSTILTATEIGDYTITATTTNGNLCTTTETVHLLPAEPATIIDFVINEYWQEDNFSLEVIVLGTGLYQYVIDDVNGEYQESNVLLNVQPGFHIVYVKEMNNCGVVSKEIATIGFKKFFTPNQDGVYDVWQVQGIAFKINEKITIFDRYGKVMHVFYPAL